MNYIIFFCGCNRIRTDDNHLNGAGANRYITPNKTVEKKGLEPSTFCLQNRRSSQLSYNPITPKNTKTPRVSPEVFIISIILKSYEIPRDILISATSAHLEHVVDVNIICVNRLIEFLFNF